MLIPISKPTTKAVYLETALLRLNILHSDFDQDIEFLIEMATDAVERDTKNILRPSTWEYRFDCWSNTHACSPWWLQLYAHPVRTIESVKYLDTNGAEQTVDAANYFWERSTEGANLGFFRTWSAPSLYQYPSSVRVRFTAGYNDPATDTGSDSELSLPAGLQGQVLLLVGHWLENREAVLAEQVFEAPASYRYLASQMKIYQ